MGVLTGRQWRRAFRDLKSIMSGSTKDKSASTSMIKTKADLQLEATTRLLTIASRLESAANVLEECSKLFCKYQTSVEFPTSPRQAL